MVVGFWKQKAGIDDEIGREYEILGIGGSWFGSRERRRRAALRLAARLVRPRLDRARRSWRSSGPARRRRACIDRMHLNGMEQPGHYRLADLPSTVWPPPVEAGEHVTQESHG